MTGVYDILTGDSRTEEYFLTGERGGQEINSLTGEQENRRTGELIF